MKFTVKVTKVIVATVSVEADSEEDAIKEAKEKAEKKSFGKNGIEYIHAIIVVD